MKKQTMIIVLCCGMTLWAANAQVRYDFDLTRSAAGSSITHETKWSETFGRDVLQVKSDERGSELPLVMNEAIDRQKLLSAIWGKYGSLIGSMVPPTDPWYDASLVNANPYDPALAKSLLVQAGYPEGFSFILDTPTYDPHPLVAEFIKSELAKIGVTVTINPISADEWYTKVFRDRDFAATLQEHVNDRDVVWYGNPDFYWGYNNPRVTELVNQAEHSATADEQTRKLMEVNRIIADEAASVWLYLYPQLVIASSRLSGYPVNGLNSQFYAYAIVKK